MLADRLGRTFLPGQAAAVGGHGRDVVGRQLQQHAAQGVAAALVIGGENGAADDLAEEAGGQFVVTGFVEKSDGGKLVRILRRQLELAPLAADLDLAAVAFDGKLLVAALAQDREEPRDRQDDAARGLDADALHVDANPDLQVGAHEDAFVVMHLQLEVLQDRLGAAGGGHAGGRLESVKQFLTLACDFHESVSLFKLLVLSMIIVRNWGPFVTSTSAIIKSFLPRGYAGQDFISPARRTSAATGPSPAGWQGRSGAIPPSCGRRAGRSCGRGRQNTPQCGPGFPG